MAKKAAKKKAAKKVAKKATRKKAAGKKAADDKPKRGRGRPPFEPTPEQRREVKAMSGIGVPQEDMATILGISRKTLTQHFPQELTEGKAQANAKMANMLYKKGMSGNVSAIIFWLKSQAGWSERLELTGKGGGPVQSEGQVHLYLPDNGKSVKQEGGDAD